MGGKCSHHCAIPAPQSKALESHIFLLPGKSSAITLADFQLALCHIVPSMYRGLDGIVEFPPVDWDNIGGLEHVKLALKRVSFYVP